MTLLEQICEINKSFLAGTTRWLDAAGDPFVVVACIDPRLTGLIAPALGLPRNRAIVIRNAGNQVSEQRVDTIRSIAVAIYAKSAREVFIMGHTDCALAQFSTAEIIENFRRLGVLRSAFGNDDLREWFGAFHDIRQNVISSLECLRGSGILPPGLRIHGLLIDTLSGKIDVLSNGDTGAIEPLPVLPPTPAEPPIAAAVESTVRPPAETTPPPLPKIETKPAPVVIAPTKQPSPPPVAPASLVEAFAVFRDVFTKERKDARFQRTLSDLRAVFRREKDPALLLAALERGLKDYYERYPRLPAAVAFCKKALAEKGSAGWKIMELLKRSFD